MAVRGVYRTLLLGGVALSLTMAGCSLPSLAKTDNGQPSPLTAESKNSLKQKGTRKLKNPGNLHLRYAQWQEQQGNVDEARESFGLVLNDNPTSIEALLGMSRLEQLAGRSVQAEQGFLQAVNLDPNNPLVLDGLGQFYAAEKRWDEAIDMLNRAMAGDPSITTYRYHLAVALASSGDYNASMPHFIQTVGDAESHYNVGYIMYQAGNIAAAETQFLQALSKKPELNIARTMLAEIRGNNNETMMAGPVPNGQYPSRQIQTNTSQPSPRVRPVATMPGMTTRTQVPIQAQPANAITAGWQPDTGTQTLHANGQPVNQQPRAVDPSAFGNQWPTQPSHLKSAVPSGLTPEQLEQLRNQSR